jgi:hypothetical protein
MLSFLKKVCNFSSFSGKYKRYHQENAMFENVYVTKNSIRAALFSCLLLLTMAACGGGSSNSPTPTTGATPTATTPAAQFKVTGVDMAVNPTSIAGVACGANLTVTYTATFHVPANSPGGTVQFSYTVNNGRGETAASITFAPGETTKTYSFTWQGSLPADHTYPEPGGVMVTSPNQLTSALVGPSGVCS